MGKATLAKQLLIEAENKVGMFAEVSSSIADAGVNMTAICAYSMGQQAIFAIITSNNAKAIEALKGKGFSVKEEEVVAVALEDTVGAAKSIAAQIKNVGISLDYLYGSTCGCADTKAVMVIVCKENEKLIAALNR